MFADPQTVTINAVANTLNRVSTEGSNSRYSNSDGSVIEVVRHTTQKSRNRREFRLTHSKVTPDPLFPQQNTPYSMSIALTVNSPVTGYSITEQKQVIDGFIAQLQATSGLLITKVLGGES